MGQRQTLPVLPLRGTVMFPGITAPIAAGRPGTLRAIENAVKGDRLVFAVAQRDNTEEPAADILFTTGVIARIGQIQRGLGGVQLLLQGEQRATALQYMEMLDAEFIAAMQVLVYAGAIMVVFLFVVMLLNLGHAGDLRDVRGKWGRIVAAFLGLALLAQVMALSRNSIDLRLATGAPVATVGGTGGIIGSVAGPLFREYLLAFELTSIVLLAAIVGAVVLAKKRS